MFSSITLKKKLLIGFCVIACVTMIAGAAGMYGSVVLNADMTSITKENLPSVRSLMRIRSEYLQAMALQRLLPDWRLGKTKRVQLKESFTGIKERLAAGQAAYEALPKDGEEQTAWSNFLSLQKKQNELDDKLNAMAEEYLATKKKGLLDNMYDLNTVSLYKNYELIFEQLDNLLAISVKKAEATTETAAAHAVAVNIILIAAMILAPALALFVGLKLIKRVTAPLAEITEVSDAIAHGDLKRKILYDKKDEIGGLADSLRKMLTGVIGEGQSIKDGVKLPMFTCDKDMVITHISEGLAPVIAAFAKRPIEEITGKARAPEVLPEFHGKLEQSLRASLSDGEIIREEHEYLLDGKTLYLDAAISPLRDLDGNIVGCMAIAVDVSASKEQQARIIEQQDQMRSLGLEINELAQKVASASEQLSASADEQARGAKQQKSQSDSVATAMEEMTSTVMEVAQNASKTAEAATQSNDAAHKGVIQVRDAVTGIQKVADSAARLGQVLSALDGQAAEIGRIIGVINDIADQTNLLALNAAIEAARAGEAGRGFAVVADEVRKLAEKTMAATKEVTASIGAIQDGSRHAVKSMAETEMQVAAGTQATNKAGEALQEIMERIQGMTMQVSQIATAAEEQSAAAEEINASVLDIAQVASESEEGAGQTAQATRELAELSQELLNLSLSFSASEIDASKLRASKGEMKGILPKLMQNFLADAYGKEIAQAMHEEMGNPVFLPTESYPDQALMQMADFVAERAGTSQREIFMNLGKYTIGQFHKLYRRYFKAKDLKEFYLTMNDTHARLTKEFPGIHPPRFTYEDKGDALVMTYHSRRGYPDYFEGILRGAAAFYGKNPDIKVETLDAERARATIRFREGTYRPKALV